MSRIEVIAENLKNWCAENEDWFDKSPEQIFDEDPIELVRYGCLNGHPADEFIGYREKVDEFAKSIEF